MLFQQFHVFNRGPETRNVHTSNEILTFLVFQGEQNEPKAPGDQNPTCALVPSRFKNFAKFQPIIDRLESVNRLGKVLYIIRASV